jgi:hypothetical protein
MVLERLIGLLVVEAVAAITNKEQGTGQAIAIANNNVKGHSATSEHEG